MRCGVRAVLRILFCALRPGIVLGALVAFGISAWDLVGGFGFGLYLGFGRCFVYCGFGRVEFVGGLRNGMKV